MPVPPIAEWTVESLAKHPETALWDMALACGDEELIDRLEQDDDFDLATLMLELKERLDRAERISIKEIFADIGQTDTPVIVTGTGSNYEEELAGLFAASIASSVLCTDDAMEQLPSAAAVIICLCFCGFTTKIKEITRKAYRHQIPFAVVFTDRDSFRLSAQAEICASIERVGCEVAAEMVFEEGEMASFVCENMDVALLRCNPELLGQYGKPMRALASVVREGASRAKLPPAKIDETEKLLWDVGTLLDSVTEAFLQTDVTLSWKELAKHTRRPGYWYECYDTAQYLPVARICVVDQVLTKSMEKFVAETLKGLGETSLARVIIKALPAQRQAARAAVLGTEPLCVRDILVAAMRPVMFEVCGALMAQEPPVPARDGWKSFCNRVGVWLEERRERTLSGFKERVVENIIHEQTQLFEALLENEW